MRINRIEFPRETLLTMPESERNFSIAIGHLLNELNVLNKLFYRCSQYSTSDPTVGKGQTTQALCMAKILAVKLAVGWEMLQNFYFKSQLSRDYDNFLTAESMEARRELGRYFGRKTNTIRTIRNLYAFHYDPEQISKSFSAASEEDGWEMLLTDSAGNSLYYFGEIVVGHGLFEHINPESHMAAMDSIIEDITSVGNSFTTFLTGCLIVISERYLLDSEGNIPIESIEIEDPPSLGDIEIPYFVSLTSENI